MYSQIAGSSMEEVEHLDRVSMRNLKGMEIGCTDLAELDVFLDDLLAEIERLTHLLLFLFVAHRPQSLEFGVV
jgi:hypothetical protein